MATTSASKHDGQVVQDVATLLPAGRDDGQHPLHEPAPVHAVGPAADPSPDHRVTQRSLRRVVRRLDPLTRANVHRPSSTLRISKHVAAVFAHGHRDPSSRACLTSRRRRLIRCLERLPLQSPVAHPVPVVEQPVRQRQQPLADRVRHHRLGRSSPENRAEDAPSRSVATAP